MKDQVLSHAQNSEAVKTSKAARLLIYVLLVLLLAAAGVVGFRYYRTVIFKEAGERELNAFKNGQGKRQDSGEHQALLDELARLRGEYGAIDELGLRIEQIGRASCRERV